MNFGCSSFSWETRDGRHLLGRTYDQFGDLRANRVLSVPAGTPCFPGLRAEADGPRSRYGYTGMAVLGFGEPVLLDGVSRMFRAFAPVDIPEGLAKADPDYEAYEQTLCTSVMCAESGVYYFAPAWNRRISAVRPPEGGAEPRAFDLGDGQDVDSRP